VDRITCQPSLPQGKPCVRNLRIDYESLVNLRLRVLNACTSMPGAMRIIPELEQEKRRYTKLYAVKPYASLFQACAYAEVYDWPNAVRCADEALEGFGTLGTTMDWDRALAHWIRGVVYFGANRRIDCRIELRNSVNILMRIAEEADRTGRYENRERCHEFMVNRLNWILTRLPVLVRRTTPPPPPIPPVPPPAGSGVSGSASMGATAVIAEPEPVIQKSSGPSPKIRELAERWINDEIEQAQNKTHETISREEAIDRAILHRRRALK
ncbi:MAG: hypothetical protein QMD04_13845, partial [Anaerolineales bacterium]|nr:hypothetical protein [Anaerolineales bacterium]